MGMNQRGEEAVTLRYLSLLLLTPITNPILSGQLTGSLLLFGSLNLFDGFLPRVKNDMDAFESPFLVSYDILSNNLG